MIVCVHPIPLLMLGTFLGWLIDGDYGALRKGVTGVIIGVILMITIVFFQPRHADDKEKP